ncbi:uncharacterized protein LOC123549746 [Mercenaria mercenaria]|uniref:uncharacterized protein LOC123549746 n=1 Tax=Mercenaria mercenaria TaxID=6596 RepID=UPI00234E9F4F|nr:uncharacterized protein LOC123549746 [Mercenaria mercenaria]XP_053400932.1 uncharacterized protein LOC123549746 [Mercenaria mercenaria]
MNHQSQLKNSKYRNWVKGGLAFKYLKQGITGFAECLVQQEHDRIFTTIGQATPTGVACNTCTLRTLKPKHNSEKDQDTGKNWCPWVQKNCNCLPGKKQLHTCPNAVCDAVFEDILNNHASSPPTPSWQNTKIENWGISPWEIAKCFINAPGYHDKNDACAIDSAGLLHLFINNKKLQSHLNCSVTGKDVFTKTRDRRNLLFHSPSMELEENKLHELIDDIIEILEDDRELKARDDAQQAVTNLKDLKNEDVHITTRTEAEVCREAMEAIVSKTKELEELATDLKCLIKDTKTDYDSKLKTLQENVAKQQAIEQITVDETKLEPRVSDVESRVAQIEIDITDLQMQLTEVHKDVKKFKDVCSVREKQVEYVKKKQVLQEKLIARYRQHYVKTSISPMKSKDNDIDISDVYVLPKMVTEEKDKSTRESTSKTLYEATDSTKFQYNNQYQEVFFHKGQEKKRIFILGEVGSGKSAFCQKLIQDWCDALETVTDNYGIDNYSTQVIYDRRAPKHFDGRDEVLSADETRRDSTDAGSDNSGAESDYSDADTDSNESTEGIEDLHSALLRQFEFLFYIPLRHMSGTLDEINQMVAVVIKGIAAREFVDELFEKESRNCLIILDGLDEWTFPDETVSELGFTANRHKMVIYRRDETRPRSPHIAKGMPDTDKAENATILTMSRPYASGIMNMKSSECDHKIRLLGIDASSVQNFIHRYFVNRANKSISPADFRKTLRERKLSHLEKTPMLLKQMLWMYCNGYEVGKSACDSYSSIINIMFAWSDGKDNGNEKEGLYDIQRKCKDSLENLQLPRLLERYPRCKANKLFIFLLSKIAFDTSSRNKNTSTFGRSTLEEIGLRKEDISNTIKYGLLAEENCFDPVYEETQLSFTHISFQEYFAAVFVSSQRFPAQQTGICARNRNHILDQLFFNMYSATDILHHSNVIQMAVGLAPELMTQLSECIYDIVLRDKSMIRYREQIKYHEVYIDTDTPLQIQQLIASCLFEYKASGSTERQIAKLCDVSITGNTDSTLLDNIDPESICSLYIFTFPLTEHTMKLVSSMKSTLLIAGCKDLTHSHCVSLFLSLVSASFLQKLVLWDIRCCSAKCNGHTFELPTHNNLRRIDLQNCQNMHFSDMTLPALESFSIIGCVLTNDQCKQLSEAVSRAKSLRQVELREVKCLEETGTSYSIDMSGHNKLETLTFDYCENMYVSGVVPTVLSSASVTRCHLPHEQCETLTVSLTEAVALTRLKLENVKCDKTDCCGHYVDLSKHDQLVTLVFIDVFDSIEL